MGNIRPRPGATLNLLYGTDPASPTETGLNLNSSGILRLLRVKLSRDGHHYWSDDGIRERAEWRRHERKSESESRQYVCHEPSAAVEWQRVGLLLRGGWHDHRGDSGQRQPDWRWHQRQCHL